MKNLLLLFPALLFFPTSLTAQNCSHFVDFDNFTSATNWYSAGVGKVFISNGVCRMDSTLNGYYDKVYRPLAVTLSNTYFKAEIKFTIEPNPLNYGVGAVLLGLGAGPLDFLSYDNSQNYATTNQDGLGVVLVSQSTTNSNIDNWYLQIISKKGSTVSMSSTYINLSSAISTYYITFERIGVDSTLLNLYSDPAHTQLIGTSSLNVNSSISGLSYLQLGNLTWGWYSRMFIGNVDDFVICDDGTTGISENNSALPLNVIPQNNGFVINAATPLDGVVEVYNLTGQLIYKANNIQGTHIFNNEIPKGIYALRVISGKQQFTQKITY